MKRKGVLGISPLAPVGMAIFFILFVLWMGLFVFHGFPGPRPGNWSYSDDGTAVQGDSITPVPGKPFGMKPGMFSPGVQPQQLRDIEPPGNIPEQ